MLSFSQRFEPYLFALDLDAGLQIFIQAIGGSYFKLNAGVPTGLNPFQQPDTAGESALRTRLAKWCRSEDGRYAGCLDNPAEFYKIGFDLTEILKDGYAPTEPVLLYLFYLRSLMLKSVASAGGIMVTVVEEFWWVDYFDQSKPRRCDCQRYFSCYCSTNAD